MNGLAAIKTTLRLLGFPFYSLFSRKFGFAIFYPSLNGWRVFTRKRFFRVKGAQLEALEYFRHFVPRRGSVVFDVGGELGFETKQLSELVGRHGRVYVFECLPQHIARLNSIAATNRNVTVVERACWNKETKVEFFVGHTPGSNTAIPDARGQRGQLLADQNGEKIVVRASTLDAMWVEIAHGAPIEFLKMDVEGAEYEALEGASEMLKHTNYAVIAAYHLRDGVRTAKKVAELFRQAGFAVRIDENHHVYATRLRSGWSERARGQKLVTTPK